MLTNNNSYKYETPYKGSLVITQCCTNGTATVQYGPIQIRKYNCWIKPYRSDKNVEDINNENMYDDSQNMITTYIPLYYILKLINKVYNQIQTETLALIHIGGDHEVFMMELFFSYELRPK